MHARTSNRLFDRPMRVERTVCGCFPRRVTGIVLATALLAVSTVSPTIAQTTNWSAGTGDWFNPGNWSSGVPTAGTTSSNVINGGTANIAGAAANSGGTLTINNGSTVDLQAGGSLALGVLVLSNNGLLLLSGSTAVGANCNPPGSCGFAPFSGVQFDGGTLRSTVTGSLPASVSFASGASGTISAAAGTTLTISGDLFSLSDQVTFGGVPGHTSFGSSTDIGTVVLAPLSAAVAFPFSSNGSVEIKGGTLRDNFDFNQYVGATIVDAGAKLDLAGAPNFTGATTQSIFNLRGSGQVQTSANPGLVLNISEGDFAGQISGAAQLEKNDSGKLTLSGTNSYTGGTVVGSGILEIGNTGSLGSGPISIVGSSFPFTNFRSTITGTLTNDISLQGGIATISAAGPAKRSR